MTILIETVGNQTLFHKPATLKEILKNPFTYKEKVRRKRAQVTGILLRPQLDLLINDLLGHHCRTTG